MVSMFTLATPSTTLLRPTKPEPLSLTATPSYTSNTKQPAQQDTLIDTQVRRPHQLTHTTLCTPCPSPASAQQETAQPLPSSNPTLNHKSSPTVRLRKRSPHPRNHDIDQHINLTSDLGAGMHENSIVETYSLFPRPPVPTSPPRTSSSSSAQEPAPKPKKHKAEREGRKGKEGGGGGGREGKYPPPQTQPPARPLPLLPLPIASSTKKEKGEARNDICQPPPPLSLIHPALRPRPRSQPHSITSPASDTGSIPIFLQLSGPEKEDALGSPPMAMKPVLHLTSLLLVRQGLEERLRGLEGILGRYGADLNLEEIGGGKRRGEGKGNREGVGERTPPPPYRSSTTPVEAASDPEPTIAHHGEDRAPDAEDPACEENKKRRKRERMMAWTLNPSYKEPSTSPSTAISPSTSPKQGKEKGKDSSQNTYATRPTYGKNLEKIFGAKPFEVAKLSVRLPSSASASARNLFHKSADPLSPSSAAQLLHVLPVPVPASRVSSEGNPSPTPLPLPRRNHNSFKPAPDFPPPLPPAKAPSPGRQSMGQQPESPSYTATITAMRSEYQETALHLAEVDLEIELAYLRGDIEQMRRMRKRVENKEKEGREVEVGVGGDNGGWF